MKTKIYIFMILILFLSCWDNLIEDNEVVVDNSVYVRSSDIVNNWRVLAMDIMPDDVSLDDTIEFTSNLVSNTATNASIVTDPDLLNNSILRFVDNSAGGSDQAVFYKPSIVSNNFTVIFRMRSLSPTYLDDALYFYLMDSSGNYIYLDIETDSFYIGGTNYGGYDTNQWHIFRLTKNGNNISLYIDEALLAGYTMNVSTIYNELVFGDNNNLTQYQFEMDWLIWYDGMAYIPTDNNVPSGLPGFPYP